jgi:TrmH RNA methyltransferase
MKCTESGILKSIMRNKLTDELAVCGLNAVIAVAENHPEQINRLFLREDRLNSLTGICKSLAERKRPYKICEDEELERICKSTHHQGVVAMIFLPAPGPLSREDLEEWSREGRTGLVLHSVGNDHNLGAIARSAAFFDVKYLVISEGDPEASLSTSAYRIAEGGMEHVTVRTIRNSAAFLVDASRSLLTIGADTRARRRIDDLKRIVEERQKTGSRPGIAVVLGNEETGLPQEVKDACSVLVRIPGTGLMESLNVAQAATLFMHRIFEF